MSTITTTAVRLEHRPGCRCPKSWPDAKMLDERRVFPGLFAGVVLDDLDRRLAEAGAPMMRTYTPQWNEAGAPIGPDMQIRSCEYWLAVQALDKVFRVLERAAQV